jgi:hypothetical protein
MSLWWRAYYAFWNWVSSVLSQGEEPAVGWEDCTCLRDGLPTCPGCPCAGEKWDSWGWD